MNDQLEQQFKPFNKKEALIGDPEPEDSEEDESMYKSIHLINKIEVEDEEVGNITDSEDDDDKPVVFVQNQLDENSI